MDFTLSEAQQELRSVAQRVALADLAPRAAEADRSAAFPRAQVDALARAGLLGLLVPRAVGGREAGARGYAVAMTEIAQACASSAVTMAVTNMVADAIYIFGNEAQHQQFIPSIVSGERVAGSFALSEPNAGSDAAALSMRAVRDGDAYVLNGEKCWITSGDVAGVILVMAKTDPDARSRGISAFLLEPDAPGFSVGRHEEKMGLRASSTVSLSFEDVRVPVSQRLGPEGIGFKVAMRALDGGRIGVASQALGIGLSALREARLRFEDTATSQDEQWALADCATELDAARLLILRAAELKDIEKPFTREASMAKLFATEAVNRVVRRLLDVGGLDAQAEGTATERAFRDARVTTIYEGTSEIQRLVIAREILKAS